MLSLHAVGRIFHAMTQASGKIPQISIVLGFAAGGAAYGPALTDLVILAPEGRIFVTGPDVVRSVTGEDVDMLRLGGPDTHGRRSGVVHVVADDEADAIRRGRQLATLLASQATIGEVADVDLAALLPESPKRAYDVHPLINGVLDEGSTVELHARWAPNVTIALGRLGGRTVGVIANNPLRLGGCLDSLSAEKAARFVRMCDTFGVPLVVLVDVPGYLPGVGQEWDGVVRRGAKLLHAFGEAVVPRVTLVTRKAYGGAYIAMNARSLGATKVFAWPGAEVAVMGPVAAVRILHRRKLAEVADDVRPQVEAELAAEHERIAGGVEKAVEIGVVDEIVSPKTTPLRAGRRHPRRRHRPARRAHQHSAVILSSLRFGRSSALSGAALRPRSRTEKRVRSLLLSATPRRVGRGRLQRTSGKSQTTWWSQRTGVPSPAYRKGSSSSSQARPRRSSMPSSRSRPPRAAETTACLRRSSATMMSPMRSVRAWKTPRVGV